MVSLALPVEELQMGQYTGRGYAVIPETGGSVVFTAKVPKSSKYKIVLRYQV